MGKKLNQSDSLRTKAEVLLVLSPPMETQTRLAEELLYELQVHQIELEMQNEELRKAQVAVEESRDRYVDLYDFAPAGYLTLDHVGMINEINLTGTAMLGVERSKLLNHRFARFVAAEYRDRWNLIFLNVLKRDGSQTCELKLLLGDGAHIYVSLDCLRITKAGQTTVRIMLTNTTERKATEQKLRNLATHLQNVREEEKGNIAREIHDDLGGTMKALKFAVHQLKINLSENDNAITHQVESMSEMINNAASITQNIVTALRPSILDDLGLLAAIEWQADKFHKLTGIQYRVNCIGDKGNLDDSHSIALFRIFQEALTNVTRHSEASKVEIEFHHCDEEILLSVSDNGRGLSEKLKAKSGSYGILGMKERVAQLGGTIRFDTSPNGGLCLMVTFPRHTGERRIGWKA